MILLALAACTSNNEKPEEEYTSGNLSDVLTDLGFSPNEIPSTDLDWVSEVNGSNPEGCITPASSQEDNWQGTIGLSTWPGNPPKTIGTVTLYDDSTYNGYKVWEDEVGLSAYCGVEESNWFGNESSQEVGVACYVELLTEFANEFWGNNFTYLGRAPIDSLVYDNETGTYSIPVLYGKIYGGKPLGFEEKDYTEMPLAEANFTLVEPSR